MDMNRRSFLRSLIAAAVATQLPALAPAEAADTVNSIEAALSKITVNGVPPKWIKLTEVAEGISAEIAFEPQDAPLYDFNPLNAGRGIAVVRPDMVADYMRQHPDEIVTTGITIGGNDAIVMNMVVRGNGVVQFATRLPDDALKRLTE